MNSRYNLYGVGLMLGVLLFASAAPAADKKKASSTPAPKEEMAQPDDAMAEKSKSSGAAEATSAAKIYRFKSAKKAGSGDAQSMSLVLEDVFTGKSQSFTVGTSDPNGTSKQPIPAVAEAAEGLAANDLVEVKTERQRSRVVAVELKKAEITPGEDRPNGYVFVQWDRQKTGDGDKVMGLKLRKFGREVVVLVPLTKNEATGDWNPPRQVDYVLERVQPGEVVEATIKPGKPPVLDEIFEFYPPERGKFIEFTQTENNGVIWAAFKMTSGNETLTVSLPGVEKQKGTTKYIQPDPKQLQTIQRLKPDTEIEVYLRSRNDYILREIKVITPPSGKTESKKS